MTSSSVNNGHHGAGFLPPEFFGSDSSSVVRTSI